MVVALRHGDRGGRGSGRMLLARAAICGAAALAAARPIHAFHVPPRGAGAWHALPGAAALGSRANLAAAPPPAARLGGPSAASATRLGALRPRARRPCTPPRAADRDGSADVEERGVAGSAKEADVTVGAVLSRMGLVRMGILVAALSWLLSRVVVGMGIMGAQLPNALAGGWSVQVPIRMRCARDSRLKQRKRPCMRCHSVQPS
jgi:hypothetical protein